MVTMPKPFRTRHRNLNDDAISKIQRVRRLMVTLVSRHIQRQDTAGLTLADEVTDLFLSALADLEEERRIMDAGADVKTLEDELRALSLQYERLEDRLTGLEVSTHSEKHYGNRKNAQQID